MRNYLFMLAALMLASAASAQTVENVRVAVGSDDVEERFSGSIKFSSSDLELVDDVPKRPDQTIGLRFNGLDIPQGAVIDGAYVQFQANAADTGAATLQIHGEDTDNAAAFANTAFDVSSRLLTATDATPWSATP